MDLSTLKPLDEPVAVKIFHPVSREDLGIAVMVYGADSAVYRKAQVELQNKRLSRMAPGKMKLSAAEIEEDALNTLAACTASWSGVFWQGEELPCSKENARMIYRELPWLREQVDQAIGDRENFMRASSSS